MMNLSNAPKNGILYALYVDRMEFFKYKNLEEIESIITEKNLLELHLFDKDMEFRAVKTRKGAFLCCEIKDDETYDDVYVEETYVDAEEESMCQKIQVVNYLKYDENDMLHIVNYRLKEVDEIGTK